MEKKLKKIFDEKAPDINFYPWVGLEYFDQKTKILLLGESHYLPASDKIMTEYVVSAFLTGQLNINFFKNISGAFLNQKISNQVYRQDVFDVWNKLSFYNFIKLPMEESNTAPKDYEISKSFLPFSQVLRILEPTIIICLSVRLYEHWLPDSLSQYQIEGKYAGKLIDNDIKERASWYYKINHNTFTFVTRFVRHPSWWRGEQDFQDSAELIKKIKNHYNFITTEAEFNQL